MAENKHGESSENLKSVENVARDTRLDFFSDKFDPLLALRVSNLKVPDEKAKVYDNLSFYTSAIEKQEKPRPKKEKKKEITELQLTRRWLPEQMPVPSTRNVKVKNLLIWMKEIRGPQKVLQQCVEQRLRIKVWTRNDRGIRGYLLAYLLAFDKHWNLVLQDVTEVWTRRKKRKAPAYDNVEKQEVFKRIKPPNIKVTPHETNNKLENCTRQVHQYLMRGEHVVSVIIELPEKCQEAS